jgi:hypothetical protein
MLFTARRAEQLLALSDDINKVLHRYDMLDEQIHPRPSSTVPVQPLGPNAFAPGTPQALAAAAQVGCTACLFFFFLVFSYWFSFHMRLVRVVAVHLCRWGIVNGVIHARVTNAPGDHGRSCQSAEQRPV